jgi:hypothetical protein
METKFIEIRDSATFIPALAIRFSGQDSWLARRAGYSKGLPMVLLIHLNKQSCDHDPYRWSNRTMQEAHLYIRNNWEELDDGDLVDVQFILGESKAQCQSEQEIMLNSLEEV